MTENKGKKGKLEDILSQIPEEKQTIAKELMDEIKFLKATLKKLKKNIKENGEVTLFEQGSQRFWRENPALKSYNTTIKNLSTLYRQLVELAPKSDGLPKSLDDCFDDFINERA